MNCRETISWAAGIRIFFISAISVTAWSGVGVSAEESQEAAVRAPSSQRAAAETFAMTWCAGGAGRREGMNAGILRVFEIELLDSPPTEAEGLPTADTRFGIIQFADEGKSRFVCGLRETSRDGKKDESFFIDLNRNGSLDEGEVLKGTPVYEGLTATEFGAIDLMLAGAGGPRKHRVFVRTNKYGPLYLTSHCYTRGRIRLGDREVEAFLLDYNCDGRYASGQVAEEDIGSLGPRELDYDTIGWDADGDGKVEWTEQNFIDSYTVSGDKVYRIDCASDGLTVTVTPLDLPMGRLQMPAGHAFVRLIGPLGPFSLLMPDVACSVPAGTYRVAYAALWETSDTGATPRFRKSGQYFEKPWTIRAGAVTVIDPNELTITNADEQRYNERVKARSGRPALPEFRSLLNAPLGELKEFGIDLGDTAAGKRILLCFFDAEQRPSRHVLSELARRHEQLRSEGFVLAAVNTSSVPWTQDFPLVVGRIQGNLEQVTTRWGIRSLPWLILTNDGHTVVAEGIGLEQLDKKLGEGAKDIAEPNAADLVREVRAGEDWLHHVDSLHVRAQSTWLRPPESIAAYQARRRTQDPNWEPDPERDDYLWPSHEDALEYVVDFRRKRLRYVADAPRREYLLRTWDANQFTQYVRRTADGYEQYDLENTTDRLEGLFDDMSWPRARLHKFWWDARDTERRRDYFGYEDDFRLVGRADYRGMACHVLEHTLRTEPNYSDRWYVGADDHLLYGRCEYYKGRCLVEHWTLDYREVAPGCRMPMTQGYILTLYDPGQRKYYTGLHRDLKVIEARVNEDPPDELFRVEFVEGIPVFDKRSGELLVYNYVAIPPSLLGKPLPDLASLDIDPASKQTGGKRILLCFADLNQRPSRRCMVQLAAAYDQLRAQRVLLLAVDISEMDRQSLNRWAQDQKIPFRLGQVDADLKKIRGTWGIRSLPWLILTDANRVVTAEGFTVSELDAKIADGGREPNKVVVTVVDAQGKTLAGVRVTEFATAGRYTTDGNGQFVCEPSEHMRYFYAVDKHRGLAEAEGLQPGSERLTLALAPARIVSGRVTDPNGRPLAGVQVAPLPMTCFYTLTDDEGRFDAGWPPSWEHPDGLCLMARHIERNLAALVDISRRAVQVDIALAPALTISGTVIDAQGAGLPGATVSVDLAKWTWTCGTPVREAATDRTGRFTLPALPQLQEYRLRVTADGRTARRVATGVIHAVKDREEIDPIVLAARGAFAQNTEEFGQLLVRVLDEDRKPVDVTSMLLWTRQDGGSHGEPASVLWTEEPGLYEIDRIRVGSYDRLSINAENLAPFSLSDAEVRKGEPKVIECRMSRGGTIQGVVVDEGGKPVMGLPVVVNSMLCRRDVKTDPNGRFSASHLPVTDYTVAVEPDAESPYATTVFRGSVSCDAKDLRIVVDRKTEVKAPASLMGTNIRQLKGLSLPFDESKVAGQSILLCLLDVNQRPSRNCLKRLGEKAKDLEDRGVIVAAVQVGSAGRDEFDKWAAENHVVLPIGSFQRDESREPVRLRPGSLPWLILTDRAHVVRAEGFGLDELTTKIKEMTNETP